MKLDKTSSKAKTKIVKNGRTKGSEPCKKLKKNTRAAGGGFIPIRKCQDRKKVCRQIVSSKQNCSLIKAGKTKKLDEKKITKTGKKKKQDAKKIAKTGKTKDSKDKCTAYFSVELLEKDMRKIFRNFSDKIILNMPGKKQERIREIQCKIAGYETKKRKILKIVSQPGTKREKISRTANALQKMKDKRTEKSKEKSTKEKRRRSPAKLPSIERNQIKRKKPENPSTEDTIKNNSADPVSESENKSKENTEDFMLLSFPINTRASQSVNGLSDKSTYHLFSKEISKPSPTTIQDSPLQPLTFNPFSGDAKIKDSIDAPTYQQTSSCQQFPTENKSKENTEDFMLLSFPINTRASQSVNGLSDKSTYHLFSKEISKPSPTTIQDSPLQPTTFNPFSGDAKIKDSTDAPGYQQTSSCQQFPTENKSKKNTEDFMLLSFPINTRASQSVNGPSDQSSYHPFLKEISKPSPTTIQGSPLQLLTFNPFSGDAKIKDSTDAPAYQQTSSSQQFPSVIFLNNTLPLGNCNRTLAKNQLPAVQQVSWKQQLASTVFSSNMAASNTLPTVEYAPSPMESTTFPFSNKMHLNGFREDTMNNLAPAFEQVSTTQSSAYAPFSRNAIPNSCGKIGAQNESLAPECASSLQQSTTVSFSNVVPLNACNASETSSEMIIISKKSFNQLCSNQKSSVKRVEDESIIRDYISGKENLLRNHVAAKDDSKQLESDKETISLGLLSSGLSNLKSKILENIEKKKIDAAKDNKQNVPPFMDLPSNKCEGKNNMENLKDKVNSSTSRIQHDNYNTGNSDCNKNKCNFKFSAPIYNYDFIPSDSETVASPDTSNISEVPMDNCIISNSSPSLNYNVLKAHLACLGLPEPFASPNIAKDFITSENSSLAFSEDRSSSNSNDSNATLNSSSESVSSQRSSCDSCLVTSSSTDDEYEENVQHSSSFDCDTLRLAADDSDICEEYSTNAVGEDLEQTESKFSLESILSPMSLLSFSDEEPRDGDSKRSSKRVRPQRKTEIKPFENGSLYWLRQGRCNRKNDCEPRKAILTRNSGSRNCNYDSLMIKYLMSSRAQEKGRSGNRGASYPGGISKSKNNHLQEQSSIQQNRKKNSNKINVKPKIEEAQFNNKMQLEQLSTNQILAQIGLNVLTYRRPSPKDTYLEKILTMCGYKT